MPAAPVYQLNPDQWADPIWRLHNLYWIVSDEGKEMPFRPNAEQQQLLENLWYLNVILKARQFGFTTLIALLGLDTAVFNANKSAGIIAHNLDDVQKIFRNKVQFPYKKLPDQLRNACPTTTDSQRELVFDNGSSIGVGTSMRSGTLQFLHVSEFGKICAKFPEKAREIVTGAFNTVQTGQMMFVESTAEGRSGPFHAMTKRAQDAQKSGEKLTPLDWRFHFFPWWQKKGYRLDSSGVIITREWRTYFEELEKNHGIKTDAAQRAWYVKKAAMNDDDMKREYPSTPDEAFEAAIKGAYYSNEMAFLRTHHRIRHVPFVLTMPVNTFWDLGRHDYTAIWFHQYIANEHRFFQYYENNNNGLSHYVEYMQNQMPNTIWGTHYFPHDADQKNLERNESRVDRLTELGLLTASNYRVVDRVEDISVGIELTRKVLPLIWIDAENCAEGIVCLDEYQKEWDDKQGVFKPTPARNSATHGADAMRQFAQGWNAPPKQKKKAKTRSWRTA